MEVTPVSSAKKPCTISQCNSSAVEIELQCYSAWLPILAKSDVQGVAWTVVNPLHNSNAEPFTARSCTMLGIMPQLTFRRYAAKGCTLLVPQSNNAQPFSESTSDKCTASNAQLDIFTTHVIY